jgi:hypothetical protein
VERDHGFRSNVIIGSGDRDQAGVRVQRSASPTVFNRG